MSSQTLKIQYRPIADLSPYQSNARTHSKRQIKQIANSIERFGFTNPVLIADDGGIIAGHGRVCETGASGPSGNRYGDAPGHSCFALVGPFERSMTLETGLSERQENMWRFAEGSLTFIEKSIAKFVST